MTCQPVPVLLVLLGGEHDVVLTSGDMTLVEQPLKMLLVP